jgi:hypothetical protein
VISGCLSAADTQLGVPVIGHVFDADSQAVKAILGVPGAARFGEALSFGERQVTKAWVGPGSGVALAVLSDGKLYRLDLAEPTVSEIDAAAPNDVIWSPSASSAALRYGDGRARVIRNLGNGEASIEAGFGASTGADAAVAAVSDDGSLLMIIRQDGTGTTLTSLGAAGEERTLLSAPGINRAAFFHNSRDAIVSDSREGKVYVMGDSGELSVLAQIVEPSALAVASDNARAFITSKSGASITSVRIADGLSTSFTCTCAPEIIERLSSGLFQVSGKAGELTWLFNPDSASAPDSATAPLTFVPQPGPQLENRSE